jgi:hypothetical protein
VAGTGYRVFMTEASLAELVALLAHDGDGTARGAENLDYGLSGALLAELSLAERITVASGRVTVVNSAPTGHALSDFALHRIAQDRKAREARDWIVRLTKDVRSAVLDWLVHTGQVRRESGKVLGVLPRDRYPTPDGQESPAVAQARRCMRLAVTERGRVDPRIAALCGLVDALGWGDRCLPDLPQQQVSRRLAEIRRSVWAANVVKDLVDEGRAGAWGPTVAKIMSNLDGK